MTEMWFIAQPPQPTDEEQAEREADVAAVHNLLDSLDAHQIHALSLILSSCMVDGGQIRAVHMHGQIVAIKRTKYGLCGCGSFHTALEHGAKPGIPKYDPESEDKDG